MPHESDEILSEVYAWSRVFWVDCRRVEWSTNGIVWYGSNDYYDFVVAGIALIGAVIGSNKYICFVFL